MGKIQLELIKWKQSIT